jgi:hypothetical protein
VELDLPTVDAAADLPKALSAVIAAMAAGEITPDEASAIASVIESKRKAIETEDLDRRLAVGKSSSTMPGRGVRTSRDSLCLRSSIGLRRKSSPSNSIRSNAHNTAAPPWRARRISSNTAIPSLSVTIASPSIRNERPGSAADRVVSPQPSV